MHFVRLPGCSVGKEQAEHCFEPSGLVVLPTGKAAKVCTAYDGAEFFCDTDYGKHESATIEFLLQDTWEPVICLTGGEPLMHERQAWFKQLVQQWMGEVHVETSGTILPTLNYDWLTVAPKQGWLTDTIGLADQVKFLVTPQTQLKRLIEIAKHAKDGCLFYLSPVFDPNELVRENLEACFKLQRSMPHWRLGCQWHKFLGLR